MSERALSLPEMAPVERKRLFIDQENGNGSCALAVSGGPSPALA